MTTHNRHPQNKRQMKAAIKRLINHITWLILFFAKQPRLELYMRKMNKINELFFQKVLKDKTNNIDTFLDTFRHNEVPKKIWIYWDQGENDAPPLVKECIKSWREKNKNWDIIVLDSKSITKHQTSQLSHKDIPIEKKSDILRTDLLKNKGGVWVDATTYCHRPLDEWLTFMLTNGFFVFSHGGPDRFIESWFIASTIKHPLITAWGDTLTEYLKKTKKNSMFYFWSFYVFQWRILKSRTLSNELSKCCCYPAPPTFKLMSHMDNRIPFTDFLEYLYAGLPLSKLNWRSTSTEKELNDLFKLVELHTPTAKSPSSAFPL